MSQSVRKEYQMCLDHMSLQMTDKVVFLYSDGSEVFSIDGTSTSKPVLRPL